MSGYKNMLNVHALSALPRIPVMPSPALAVGEDEMRASIPLLIHRDAQAKIPAPIMPDVMHIPYEQAVAKGSGDTLSMANFETENFDLGDAYDFII